MVFRPQITSKPNNSVIIPVGSRFMANQNLWCPQLQAPEGGPIQANSYGIMSVWMKAVGGTQQQSITNGGWISNSQGGEGPPGSGICWDNASGNITLRYNLADLTGTKFLTGSVNYANTTYPVVYDQWAHYLLSWDTSIFACAYYLNGVRIPVSQSWVGGAFAVAYQSKAGFQLTSVFPGSVGQVFSDMEIAEIWMDCSHTICNSTGYIANSDIWKFYNPTASNPFVSLNDYNNQGAKPYGYQPTIYFPANGNGLIKNLGYGGQFQRNQPYFFGVVMASNPAVGNVFTFGNSTSYSNVYFVASGATGSNVNIGADANTTRLNFATMINSSVDPFISKFQSQNIQNGTNVILIGVANAQAIGANLYVNSTSYGNNLMQPLITPPTWISTIANSGYPMVQNNYNVGLKYILMMNGSGNTALPNNYTHTVSNNDFILLLVSAFYNGGTDPGTISINAASGFTKLSEGFCTNAGSTGTARAAVFWKFANSVESANSTLGNLFANSTYTLSWANNSTIYTYGLANYGNNVNLSNPIDTFSISSINVATQNCISNSIVTNYPNETIVHFWGGCKTNGGQVGMNVTSNGMIYRMGNDSLNRFNPIVAVSDKVQPLPGNTGTFTSYLTLPGYNTWISTLFGIIPRQ